MAGLLAGKARPGCNCTFGADAPPQFVARKVTGVGDNASPGERQNAGDGRSEIHVSKCGLGGWPRPHIFFYNSVIQEVSAGPNLSLNFRLVFA